MASFAADINLSQVIVAVDGHLSAPCHLPGFGEECRAFGAPIVALDELILTSFCVHLVLAQQGIEVADLLEAEVEVVAVLASEAEAVLPIAFAKFFFLFRSALGIEPRRDLGALDGDGSDVLASPLVRAVPIASSAYWNRHVLLDPVFVSLACVLLQTREVALCR